MCSTKQTEDGVAFDMERRKIGIFHRQHNYPGDLKASTENRFKSDVNSL